MSSNPTSQEPNPADGQNPQVVYVQEPKKPWYKRPGCLIPLIIVVLLILAFGGCMATMNSAVDAVDEELNAEHTVTYAVEGDAQDALVTYSTGEGDTSQDNGVAAGWTKDVTVKGLFGATLSATNGMNDEGSITCKIIANGETVVENTATGVGATASCTADITELDEGSEG